MKINGTLINYYFHCKRQCWLHANRLNMEDNSEEVHIGRVLHELQNEGKENSEIKIENIAVDKITNDYVTELKKSDADIEAAEWQLLYYLKVLKDKGVKRKGRLVFDEKNKQDRKTLIIELTEEKEKELEDLVEKITELVNLDKVPEYNRSKKCFKCSYYEYCQI